MRGPPRDGGRLLREAVWKISLAFAVFVTWFGVFLIMRGGLVRQLLSN